MNDLTTLRMSDETISQIARLLQVAILSGTDVVDNLRTLRLVSQEDMLYPDPNFIDAFEGNLQKMLEEVVNISEDNVLKED